MHDAAQDEPKNYEGLVASYKKVQSAGSSKTDKKKSTSAFFSVSDIIIITAESFMFCNGGSLTLPYFEDKLKVSKKQLQTLRLLDLLTMIHTVMFLPRVPWVLV